MSRRKRQIVFCYQEVVGYVLTLMEQISRDYDAKVWVVRSSAKPLTPFVPTADGGDIEFIDQGSVELCSRIEEIGPDLICVSGWRNMEYLRVARRFKGRVPVACLFDNQWVGSLKQRVATMWPLKSILKLHFDKLIVAGPHQFCYGRMLGFEGRDIVLNLYSGDTGHFGGVYESARERKAHNFPHRFIYIGRFSPEKGCDLLIGAFNELCRSRDHDWHLILVGNGVLPRGDHNTHIVVKPFMDKDGLGREIADAGVFCMPSHHEPWGVAVHEAAAAGLPLLLSDACASAPVFLIAGYNGHSFRTSSQSSLANRLAAFVETSDSDLLKMSDRSHALGQRITPALSAASFLSVLAERS